MSMEFRSNSNRVCGNEIIALIVTICNRNVLENYGFKDLSSILGKIKLVVRIVESLTRNTYSKDKTSFTRFLVIQMS